MVANSFLTHIPIVVVSLEGERVCVFVGVCVCVYVSVCVCVLLVSETINVTITSARVRAHHSSVRGE